MADKVILATLPKLNGSNWFEWKKEAETFLLLAGLDGIIDAKDIPTGAKATKWNAKDHKTYAYLFFFIKLNYHVPIINIKSSHKAWKKLVARYEKDSATTHVALCQQFYLLTHNPAVGITVFIDAVFSIVRQLAAIGHKPDDLEISDKLLIRLHQLWLPVCATLTLCKKTEKPKIKLITSMLKQFKAKESLVAVPGPLVKVEKSEPSLAELALYVKRQGGGWKGSKGRRRNFEEHDWGNMKEQEGVCWRCGWENHMARNCVANMPEDVKRKVVDHAHIAITSLDEELFTFASDEAHDNPFCESVTYDSWKQGKLKPGCPRKWIGEKGTGEFLW
jgi:hypothetical protein